MTHINKQQISELLKQISVVVENLNRMRCALDSRLATHFSIFEITNYDERMLSAVVAHLLNPRGTHAQQERYIKLFLDLLKTKTENPAYIVRFEENGNLKNTQVKTEDTRGTDGRFIDVTAELNGLRFGIENKLYAKDQHKQLSDYLAALRDGFLVYLRIDGGRLPARESISELEFQTATRVGRLILLDYTDIEAWLNACIQATLSEKIRWYLGEVKNLINTHFYHRSDFMEEGKILEELLAGSKNLETAIFIRDHLWLAIKRVIETYIDFIKSNINNRMNKDNWYIEDNSSSLNYDKPYQAPLLIRHKKYPDVSVRLEFQGKLYTDPIYGIVAGPAHYEQIKRVLPIEKSSDTWPTYKPFWPNYWGGGDFLLKLNDFAAQPDIPSEPFEKAQEVSNFLIEIMEKTEQVLA